MTNMKKYLLTFFSAFSAFANFSAPLETPDQSSILIQNTILAKINEDTISVLDVKKKLDMIFYRNYPHLANSTPARCQFYESQWRHALMEMIDQQLMLADAEEKKIPLSDGEVREEMERRFGPNIMLTLDKMDLTYDESWKMVKNDLLVQRMSWWFIHSKAITQVTPQDIRQAFRAHLKEHPAFEEWKYHVIAVRGNSPEETANRLHQTLLEKNTLPDRWVEEFDPAVQLSAEFVATDQQISDAHKTALVSLSPGQYSAPILQQSKTDRSWVARIFYLKDKVEHPAPQFDAVAQELRDQLVQKISNEESALYLQKLRKNHTFYENIPDDFHPFSIQ